MCPQTNGRLIRKSLSTHFCRLALKLGGELRQRLERITPQICCQAFILVQFDTRVSTLKLCNVRIQERERYPGHNNSASAHGEWVAQLCGCFAHSSLIRRPKVFHAQAFGNHFRRDAEFWRDARGDVIERAHFSPIPICGSGDRTERCLRTSFF